ncbi:hypothetical protein AB0M43_14540 [Longispora sp. NPDC051575]|uniref:hypothetical protein n=1 Tax=Longispora sp. NPDC051575 TaxID=3154943 RepID=UPI003421588A
MNQHQSQGPVACAGDHAQTCAAQHTLAQLRKEIRQQFARAVDAEALELDLANGMLECFDMQPLNHLWKVVVTVPITLEVRAEDAESADEVASSLIENALRNAADVHELDVRWNERHPEDAEPGGVDTENP